MNIQLASNIKANRKRLKLTQEKLAESLGVTVGAVHKWESGMSVPELPLIIRMADLFDLSMDVLIGYEIKNNNLSATLNRIMNGIQEKDITVLNDIEQAITKYPHSFNIIYRSAQAYNSFGIEKKDKKMLRRSIELGNIALSLISQNKNTSISDTGIKKMIANAHCTLEEYDIAAEILIANNPDGINNSSIGQLFAGELKRYDEAKTYLSLGLIANLESMLTNYFGYILYYRSQNKIKEIQDFSILMADYLEGLKKSSKPSYVDKFISQINLILAYTYHEEDSEKAVSYIKKAVSMAKKYDESPSFSVTDIKYVNLDESYAGFDSTGNTAVEGLYYICDKINSKSFNKLFDEAAKADKKK